MGSIPITRSTPRIPNRVKISTHFRPRADQRTNLAARFFEIGPLLALTGKWQKLDRIRILMGGETTARTRQTILEGLRRDVCDRPDTSLEREKEANDLLAGTAAIAKALHNGNVPCRVYAKRKFHAVYITHPEPPSSAPVALVGSSISPCSALPKTLN